ncbi:hypothetical protein FIBSPDRAFT_953985 [Athelia psychrophila]|uniref:Uncharacterized protein n=1 Tax=Athelia psychrophila TaxID=1759441 RepID=A0A166JMG5_9AGAM|nr:hypothetical protein FIBSPDRAFT_953985 [Fibularhizoctonia sp. CBS 109695]
MPLDVNTDLFSQGFDSSSNVSRQLERNVPEESYHGDPSPVFGPSASKAVQRATQNVVFSHPTIG